MLVDNTRRGEQIPSGHYDWFNYGGIHRSVELVEVPEVFVKRFHVALSKNVKNQIVYNIEVEAGKSWAEGESAEAVIEIAELGIRQRVRCTCGSRPTGAPAHTLHASGSVPVDESAMNLWSPESPYLYKVRITCGGDCLTDEIGFRRIDRDGSVITLNGKPVLLRGMCVHEAVSYTHLTLPTKA